MGKRKIIPRRGRRKPMPAASDHTPPASDLRSAIDLHQAGKLDEAERQDFDYIWLGTESDNEPARALYRKLGARETEGLVIYDWGEEEVPE